MIEPCIGATKYISSFSIITLRTSTSQNKLSSSKHTKVIKIINYSWCDIGHGRVYKCIAILLGPTERAVYEVWYSFYFLGGGGGG